MQYIHSSMLLTLISVCFAMGCAAQEYVTLSSCDDACVAELERKALGGDALSAKKLTTHYAYVNPSEIRYWEQISAENGDPISQRNLAIAMLVYSDDPRDHMRGVFWLEKAAAAGTEYAAEELERYRKGGREAIQPDPSRGKP
jgi:TPR repeat protein